MYYRIGLDIGVASVGWCAMKTDENGEPTRILQLGSRVFDSAEVPKTGASLAAERRLARGARRRLRRRIFRLECAKKLFEECGIDISNGTKDTNMLRVQALDEQISEQDFARVLYMLIKRRGFKSNKRGASKEEGKLLKATAENSRIMRENDYRTIGEMYAKMYCCEKNGKQVFATRNKGGDYSRTVLRVELEDEIRRLFEAQKRFNNAFATDANRDKVIEIFNMQRNYDDGPGKGSHYSATYKVGNCQFEADELRAPCSSYSFERSAMLQKLNNLVIIDGPSREKLTAEQRKIVLGILDKKGSVSYAAARKALKLGDTARFNAISYSTKKKDVDVVEHCEKATFIRCTRSKAIIDCLSGENKSNMDIVDEIAVVLSNVKSDENRKEHMRENELLTTLSEDEIDKLLELDCDKFGMLSLKALRNILPYLEQGFGYSEACNMAGYNHSAKQYDKIKFLNTKEVYDAVAEINSPVVKRSISQTLKVVNALILKYGSPLAINVELARDMGKSKKAKDEIEKENKERRENNDKIRKHILENFQFVAKRDDVLKYKLYEEQNGKCIYSDKPIDINRLFEPNYVQIDHIIPYGRCFNDSFNNKVLVLCAENQNKWNKTPYEYFGNSDKWDGFVSRVCATYKSNLAKMDKLLKKEFNEDEWKDRALNDTRYVSKYAHALFNDFLLFEKGEMGKKRVVAVNGSITSHLRHQWGIRKIREDGDLHHAVDATIIACVTNATVKRLSTLSAMPLYQVTDDDRAVAMPYKTFAKELAARCLDNKNEMDLQLLSLGYSQEEVADVKPVFVSRMTHRKGKGALHAETLLSAKYTDKGIIVSKVPLTSLKLIHTENGYEIANYFNPQDDRLTYELLLDRLIAAKGNAAVAFAEKVEKPCQAGKTPNEIKKVKVYEKCNTGVLLQKSNAFAKNIAGAMIRLDVFKKEGKFYYVPVYTSDLYRGVLPNLAPLAHIDKEGWIRVDDTFEFLFALYKYDLIYIKRKKPMSFPKIRDNTHSQMPEFLEFSEGFVYYRSFNIANVNAELFNHNGCYSARVGMKTLLDIKKFEIDALGNIREAGKEKRPKLSLN